ncbi:MAG TPA: nuclease A inhibitor family protein [Actinomycetes bacterium]|jgi:hypothetical protein|nr:nuclease A inhibitor family protein [Actinomycetes bacterium]
MAFANLMVDQSLTSESDYPYEPFTAEMQQSTRLTRRSFCDAVGLEPSPQIEMHPATDFFKWTDDPEPEDTEMAQVYALLWKMMRGTLKGLTLVRARGEDVVQVPVFLFGRLEDGTLVGLRSISIET